MKKIFALSLLFLVGCSNVKESNTTNIDMPTESAAPVEASTDDAIAKSDSIACMLHTETENTNKTITKKITTDKQKIAVITKELVATKTENELLKDQVTKVKTIIVRDTVFISETKNFWGKKKTTVKAVKDSTATEEIEE